QTAKFHQAMYGFFRIQDADLLGAERTLNERLRRTIVGIVLPALIIDGGTSDERGRPGNNPRIPPVWHLMLRRRCDNRARTAAISLITFEPSGERRSGAGMY